MTKQQAIGHFKGIPALATALSISYQAVHNWPDRVPSFRQLQLQILTDGALTADAEALGVTPNPEQILVANQGNKQGVDSAVQASSTGAAQ